MGVGGIAMGYTPDPNLTGFGNDQAARRAASTEMAARSVAMQGLAKQINTGGILSYFTDTDAQRKVDAPKLAQLRALQAGGAVLPASVSNKQAQATPVAAAASRTPTLNDLPVWAGDGLRGTPFTLDAAFAAQNKGPNAVVVNPDNGQVARPTMAAAPQGFDATISRFAEAAGGMSLNEMAMLSDVSAKTRKSEPKPQTQSEVAQAAYLQFANNEYLRNMQKAKKSGDPVDEESASATMMARLGLAGFKGNPIDGGITPSINEIK